VTQRTAAWVGVWASIGLADFILNRRHDGSTFSEVTRHVFKTHHPIGRTVFTVALVGGGYAFHRHITKGQP